VVDASLALRASQLVDLLILVERVVVVVCRRDFLEDNARFLCPERMPHSGLYENGIAGVKLVYPTVNLGVEHAIQHLEGLLLLLVEVSGVLLVGKLNHELLAVLAVDAVDQHCAGLAKVLDSIVM
jgi:hypothetical protein